MSKIVALNQTDMEKIVNNLPAEMFSTHEFAFRIPTNNVDDVSNLLDLAFKSLSKMEKAGNLFGDVNGCADLWKKMG